MYIYFLHERLLIILLTTNDDTVPTRDNRKEEKPSGRNVFKQVVRLKYSMLLLQTSRRLLIIVTITAYFLKCPNKRGYIVDGVKVDLEYAVPSSVLSTYSL